MKSLHQARVATRRLRAALVPRRLGRKAEKVARSVRRLTRLLGPVRELDVMLLILDELERRRRAARRDPAAPYVDCRRAPASLLRTSSRSDRRFRHQKVRKRALAVARRAAKRKSPRDREAVALARERAARRAQSPCGCDRDTRRVSIFPDRLHDVRIAIKKLRYTLELIRVRASAVAQCRVTAHAQEACRTCSDGCTISKC